MLYTSLSKAFKSGGYSESGTNADLDAFEFDEEEVVALEIGGKTTLLDGAATLNFAVFRTEYDDLQVSAYDGVSFIVDNAAKAISQGIEVDGVVRLTEALTMNASMAYLDASYDEYDSAGCNAAQIAVDGPSCTQDLGGKTLAHAPEWTANVGLDHQIALGDNLELFSHIDFAYSDESYLSADLDESGLEDAHTTVNARVALSSAEGNWEVALLGKNLTDETIRTFVGDASFLTGAQFTFMDAPRTVAIQVKLAL